VLKEMLAMRAEKRVLVITVAALIVAAALGVAVLSSHHAPHRNLEGVKRALIYDSLYREYPNNRLIENLTSTLRMHGYQVDIYLGRNATLSPLENITHYSLVIIRAHGAFNNNPNIGYPIGTYIYTGLHVDEALKIYGSDAKKLADRGYLAEGVIPPPGMPLTKENLAKLPKYVTVSPRFFRDFSRGEFPKGAIVIYFGCYGLDDDTLGNVFLDKGASAYIAWRGNVTWSHMDRALQVLVAKLLSGKDARQAVAQTNAIVGPDPSSKARLGVLAIIKG